MKKGIIVGSILLAALLIGISGYSLSKISAMEKTLAEKTAKISSLETQIKALEAADHISRQQIERTNISTALLANYVVTNKLFIESGRMSLNTDEIYIDIKPQPSYMKYFEGQGKINLPDRDLKASLKEVITDFEGLYSGWKNGSDLLPDFSKIKIYMTENGYDIGTYSGGTIKLAGE